MRNLVIGDIHEPVSHPAYLRFCEDMYVKYDCNHVTFIGDLTDWHAISFHAQNPESPGPKDEYELARVKISKWVFKFPKAVVCIGNHDERVIRLASSVNIPPALLRTYREIWKTPRWRWVHEFIMDDVFYFHGTGSAGIHPAYTAMTKRLMSVVQGHIHSAAGIKWRASPQRRTFGMDTGCGIDDQAVAFAYGRANPIRSIISVGLVIDGIPYHEVMPMARGERYHKSRFKHKR